MYCFSIVYCVGAETSILMSNSDGLGPYHLCREMQETRPMSQERDGKVFISTGVGIFPL